MIQWNEMSRILISFLICNSTHTMNERKWVSIDLFVCFEEKNSVDHV